MADLKLCCSNSVVIPQHVKQASIARDDVAAAVSNINNIFASADPDRTDKGGFYLPMVSIPVSVGSEVSELRSISLIFSQGRAGKRLSFCSSMQAGLAWTQNTDSRSSEDCCVRLYPLIWCCPCPDES